ncbi:hypothetical protein RhiirA5_369551 [Rhizophagus irregularis]|uniref:Uncharacterized protein n=2 Tax=Rhizophagus irregularis TaxID=588596 RepID=A0A2N0QCK5_9GLOM|nr:hypothetical protein GLOIN_2v1485573 [Rhizophagus irregularis DAOM 181602=DAOM 197198]PKC16777.1 hypothetical protein RhiirA5_369551 [Rhizophagus irregularis]POG62264.1 hypothetical protein GLOIN_2v1485573 [Rhizophagus irregularis DAOM 181602=DAOM 197198]CAB5193585.1 unnamed protein product [Rhizophagus irregularis]|eukprot:XP_025169130.1 hypothetical protein GLOIN_2v1485573 [Rhizophagus irregularis DAOM 181602=DAOM 197198]
MQRRKRAEYKIAAQDTKLVTFFFKKDKVLKILEPNDNDSENQIADLDFESILSNLKALFNDKTLSIQSRNRLQLIFQFINLRKMGYKTMNASRIVAKSIGKGKYQVELIVWTKNFLKNKTIPTSEHGKYQKIKSLL